MSVMSSPRILRRDRHLAHTTSREGVDPPVQIPSGAGRGGRMRAALRQRTGQRRPPARGRRRNGLHIQRIREAVSGLLGSRRSMEKAKMKTVTLEVASREDVTRRALEVFRGKKQAARISFATPELLHDETQTGLTVTQYPTTIEDVR